jgi:SIR2-like domain
MIANPNIDELVLKMSERCNAPGILSLSRKFSEYNGEPYILFLGVGCSVAAGAPTMSQLAQKVLELVSSDESYADFVPPTNVDDEERLKYFYKLTDSMSPGQRFRILQSFFANIPVPIFYQQLAVLIKAGYFTKILTTNFDTLLEQACNGAGLELGYDYEVTTPTTGEANSFDNYWEQSTPANDKEIVQIIKLHGDISQQQLDLAPWRIEELLMRGRRAIKSELKGDMIIVGYEFESIKVNEWLQNTSRAREELWWINSTLLNGYIDINNWADSIKIIPENIASPEAFFNQLSLRLVRLPVLNTLNETQQYYKALNEFSSSNDDKILESVNFQQIAEPTSIQDIIRNIASSEEDLLAEDLRGNIRQAQILLNSLEQSAPPGNIPANIEHQINYQKEQITILEDQLRNLPSSRVQIRILMVRVINDIKDKFPADDFKEILSYLGSQRKIIEKEYKKNNPNQNLIAAAVTTTALLVERLNINSENLILDKKATQELMSFVPNILKKGGV